MSCTFRLRSGFVAKLCELDYFVARRSVRGSEDFENSLIILSAKFFKVNPQELFWGPSRSREIYLIYSVADLLNFSLQASLLIVILIIILYI